MLKRTISGAALLVLAFIAFYFGGYVLFTVTLFISLLGMYELFRVFQIERTPQALLGYIGTIGYYVALLFEDVIRYTFPFMCAFVMLLLISYVLTFPKVKAIQVACVPFAFIYVAVLMSFVYRIRILEGGQYFVWVVLLGSWGSDTFAYLAGVTMGKHKAFPVLSPKKTWEGCAGGVLGAILLGGLFGFIFANRLPEFGSVPAFVVVGLVCGGSAILSMFGDLTASAIKRDHNVKDYGKLIPGHGGIMDRFDSVLFTAPTVYFLIILFKQLM